MCAATTAAAAVTVVFFATVTGALFSLSVLGMGNSLIVVDVVNRVGRWSCVGAAAGGGGAAAAAAVAASSARECSDGRGCCGGSDWLVGFVGVNSPNHRRRQRRLCKVFNVGYGYGYGSSLSAIPSEVQRPDGTLPPLSLSPTPLFSENQAMDDAVASDDNGKDNTNGRVRRRRQRRLQRQRQRLQRPPTGQTNRRQELGAANGRPNVADESGGMLNSKKMRKTKKPLSSSSSSSSSSLPYSTTNGITKQRVPNTRAASIARGRDPLLSLNMNLDSIAKSASARTSTAATFSSSSSTTTTTSLPRSSPHYSSSLSCRPSSSSSSSNHVTLGAARRAEELLRRIEALHMEGYYDAPPDAVSYNSVMNAYALAGGIEGAREAERILREMLSSSSLSSSSEKINEPDKKSVIDVQKVGKSVVNSSTAVVAAAASAKTMKVEPKRSTRPNVVSFNTVIQAFANCGQAERAESILGEMEELCRSDSVPEDCRPNTITYNECINAWAKVRNPQRAEALLRRMMEVSHAARTSGDKRTATAAAASTLAMEDEDDVKPDTIAFNTVLHAWASSGGGRDAAIRAENLLRHMDNLYLSGNDDVKPDVVSYTSVISAWASSRDDEAPERATYWLEVMNQLYQQTNDDSIRPNAVSYTCVINAIARSCTAGSAARAHDVLQQMEELYENGDRPDLKPDAVCYSSVIDAYARSAGRPSTWEEGGGGREMAAHSAEMLLDRMNELYRTRGGDVGVRPNVRTYCSVLTALGRSGAYGAAERAEELLDRMERMYAFGDNDCVKPGTVAYNAVIDAYARSGLVDKAERAQELLDRMLDRVEGGNGGGVRGEGDWDAAPDVVTYNSVLHAAASTYARQDPSMKRVAFRIALDAFKAAGRDLVVESTSSSSDASSPTGGAATAVATRRRRPIRRTSVTYTLFLKSIRKLVTAGPERDAMVRKTFEHCVSERLVNAKVLEQLRICFRGETERREGEKDPFSVLLMSCGHRPEEAVEADLAISKSTVEWKDLPEEWSRNSGRRR